MKKFLTLLVFTIFLIGTNNALFGAGFIVMSFEERGNDLAARVDEVLDAGGEACALIKVQTDLKDIVFKGAVRKWLDKGNGEYWVYVQSMTRRLKIRKTGFMPLDFDFGLKAKGSTVYKMKLTSDGTDKVKKLEDIAVNIISDPAGAYITIDGVKKGKIKQIDASIGKHKIILEKAGFEKLEKTITVSAKKTLFEFKMKEESDALVKIKSEPAGAIVKLDGVKLGKTPLSMFYPVGNYNIKLEKDLYDDYTGKIKIISPETSKNFTLQSIMATLTIKTNSAATIYINDVEYNNLTNIQLEPQVCKIRAEMPRCKSVSEQIILKKRANKTVELYPEITTGVVQIAVVPDGAEISLVEDYAEGDAYSFSSTGSKSFGDVPIGSYKLTVKAKGYKSFKEDIVVTAERKVRKSVTLEKGADVCGDMIFVQGGTFQMGSNDGRSDEKPIHSVTVDDFYIGKYEVTQKEWKEVMGNNPSNFKGDNLPVENVSWNDIQEFLRKLNTKTGANYRLPTEAEWEYAAKGGNKSRGYKYSGSDDGFLGVSSNDVAWYRSNSGSKTYPVGTKQPNELGIYDMSGNVWEWCSDWYDKSYYGNSSSRNPKGSLSGSYRVIRGGSWDYDVSDCRVAGRNYDEPSRSINFIGFRVVRTR